MTLSLLQTQSPEKVRAYWDCKLEGSDFGRIKLLLDRKVVAEFLDDKLKGIDIPKTIKKKELVEAFCQFTEDDYYEWLKDNFATFFNHYNPDWDWIKEYIDRHRPDWE